MYMQPVIILSILFGIWGMNMTIKMLNEVLKDHLLQAKFVVLQLVLLLAKLQGLTARIVVWCGLIACKPPITPAVYANRTYKKMIFFCYPHTFFKYNFYLVVNFAFLQWDVFVCGLFDKAPSALLVIQSVTGGTDQTSGECSLGQTIPI